MKSREKPQSLTVFCPPFRRDNGVWIFLRCVTAIGAEVVLKDTLVKLTSCSRGGASRWHTLRDDRHLLKYVHLVICFSVTGFTPPPTIGQPLK